jgi:hypothetical protein
MINFFRKTRKKLADDNRFFKYWRYAIGEIVLVVVGILIALSINNWNQNRINNQKLKSYLTEIVRDLRIDSSWISDQIETLKIRNKKTKSFLAIKDCLTSTSLLSLMASTIKRKYVIIISLHSAQNSLSLMLIA